MLITGTQMLIAGTQFSKELCVIDYTVSVVYWPVSVMYLKIKSDTGVSCHKSLNTMDAYCSQAEDPMK